MNKFLCLFLAFLVSTAAAMPQDRLAPAAHAKRGSNVFTEAVPRAHTYAGGSASESESGGAHPRQVHNADYGSNNGPSGNPQTAKQTSTEADAPAPTDHDSKPASGAADNSSKQQKRRDFVPRPSHDINYSDS